MKRKKIMTKICICLGVICFLLGYYFGTFNIKNNDIEREKTGYEILQEGLNRIGEINNDK